MKYKIMYEGKIAKIKDNFIFDKHSKGSHFYEIKEGKSGNVVLYGLTHLYKPDKKRMEQVQQGLLEKVYLEGFEAPSGRKIEGIRQDIDGHLLTEDSINKHSIKKIYALKIYK